MKEQKYLLISSHVLMKYHLRAEKVAFWNNLIPQLVRRLGKRRPCVDNNFSYNIYMWLVLGVAGVPAVVVTLLSMILLTVIRRTDALEHYMSKTILQGWSILDLIPIQNHKCYEKRIYQQIKIHLINNTIVHIETSGLWL